MKKHLSESQQNKLVSIKLLITHRLWHSFFGYPKQKINKRDYDEYWSTRFEEAHSHLAIDDNAKLLVNIIKPDSSVLEIGCGNGRNLYWLKKYRNIKEKGLDVSNPAVNFARKNKIDASVCDISKDLEISEKYDYIISIAVLEHIPNPEQVLEKVKGHFRKNLIIQVPNYGQIFHRLRLLFGKAPLDWWWHPSEHLRHWTISDMKWMLTKANKGKFTYKIEKIYGVGGIPLLNKICKSLFSEDVFYILK
ncbi:class I SAM-dependent methyltransferase [Candidatus Woesearchaeota archaeon]|nr:class I SAM-dependent methyltransferase [Candidatus Woesearchaeota archaeon]